MAAAATEMGLLPGTRSSSTAFLAMKVAAICTCLGKPRLEQKRDMKSPVVMRSTLVSRAFRISLKHRPISFFEILETAQISGGEGQKQGWFLESENTNSTETLHKCTEISYQDTSFSCHLLQVIKRIFQPFSEAL